MVPKKSVLRNVPTILLILISYFFLLLLLVYVERGGEDSNLTSLSDALWWSVITLTTIGYGDYFPKTILGKFISVPFILGSMGLLGFFVGKLASLYTDSREHVKLGYKGTDFTHHIVIIGWNRFAQIVTEELIHSQVKVAIVTNDRQTLELLREQYDRKSVFLLFADYNNLELLHKTNLDHSSIVFINMEDDTEKLVYLLNCQKFFSDSLRYSVSPHNHELTQTFKNAGATFVFSKEEIASRIIASYIFEPDVAEYTKDLISAAVSKESYDIKEYRVTQSNPFKGHYYNDVFFTIREQFDVILIGIAKFIDGQYKLLKSPEDHKLTIEVEDYLVVIANGPSAAQLTDAFGVKEGRIA